MTRIDETLLRRHLDRAIAEHDQAFETFFLARFLNLSFDYLPEGARENEKEFCRVTCPVSPLIQNPQGVVHGGALATIADISMGHLVNKTAGAGATIEMKVQFMRAVSTGVLVAEGRYTRRGRRIAFMESHIRDADERLVAHATATWSMPNA